MAETFTLVLTSSMRMGRVRVGAAQSVRKGAVDAVVLGFVRDGKRKSFLLTQIGKTFHGIAQMARGSINIQ
jgi:hypothetical protein